MERRPGAFRRVLSALLGQVVPASLGLVAGSLALTFVPLNNHGIGACIATFLLVWFSAAWGLARVRENKQWRRLYRLAVFGHVLFWSYVGIAGSSLRAPGVPQVRPGTHDGADMGQIRAGVGEAAFVIPRDVTLGGWGMRPRRYRVPAFGGIGILGRLSQDFMAGTGGDGMPRKPLFFSAAKEDAPQTLERVGARAISISCGDGVPMTWVRLDLVTVSPGLVADILTRVKKSHPRVTPDRLVVAASHTHSCMAGYSEQRLSALAGTDHLRSDVRKAVADAALQAISIAWSTRSAAQLAPFMTHDRLADGRSALARNRRKKNDTDIDDRVFGIRVDSQARETIAILLNYAVHPTVLKRHTCSLHRDLVGSVEEAVSKTIPSRPMTLFLNGAQGDIGPARIEGYSDEFRADALAERFARVLKDTVTSAAPYTHGRMHTAFATCDPGSPFAIVAGEDRAGWAERFRSGYVEGSTSQSICDVLSYPGNALLWSIGLSEARVAFDFGGGGATMVSLDPSMEQTELQVGAWILELGDSTNVRFRTVGVWQPGEATQALGKSWRAMAASRGYDHCMIAGLAGGACAYLTTPEEYDAGGYEALATLYGPRGGELIGAAFEGALDACDPKGE